jgi:hypothetical protein
LDLTPEDKTLLQLLFEPKKAKLLLSFRKTDTKPPENDLDWTCLVEKSRQEGVSAVLFHNITKYHLEDLVPGDSYRSLSNDYYTNLKRNLSIIGTLRKVLAAFQKAGTPCIILKGISLAEHLYPNMAMRGMSDVDVLVRKEDLFKADDCLSRLGYASRDSSAAKAVNNPAGYLASLEYRKNDASPLDLHLHWHTVNTSVPATMFVDDIDLDRLWESAEPICVADGQALMLRPEHLIIYLCEHALRVGHSFDRLILICDIFFALKTLESTIDWSFLVKESRRFNLSRFVYFGLSIVKHHTSLAIPNECLDKLKPANISWGEKCFLSLQFNNRRIRGSSYFIYLAMNRGLTAKIRFITRTFFPPRQILLQRGHGKGSESTKSYYLFRIREIFSYIIRSVAQNLLRITK